MRPAAPIRAAWLLALVLVPAAPAMAEELRDPCFDRPGLGTPACTVDEGHVAVEVGLAGWSLDRSGEERSDSLALGDVLIRYGATESLEIQLGWTALGRLRVRSAGTAVHETGSGDATVALRQNIAGPDGSGLSAAVMPFATLPVGTAPDGAGIWTAGLIVPMSYELTGGSTLGFTAEADLAADADGRGRHLAYGATAGLGFGLGRGLEGAAEIQAGADEDPAGRTGFALAGLSLALALGSASQLDVGLNLGLSRHAEDIAVYAGIARRF